MFTTQNSRSVPVHAIGGPHVTQAPPEWERPTGSSGLVTLVTDSRHTDCYVVCKTLRGRGGWGVHNSDGTLLVSGWPTKTRAVAYAERQLAAPARGAR